MDKLTEKFIQLLHQELGSELMTEVVIENTRRNDNTCATHDHCDANVVMMEAYEFVYGVELDPIVNLICVNKAWDIAKDCGYDINVRLFKSTTMKAYDSVDVSIFEIVKRFKEITKKDTNGNYYICCVQLKSGEKGYVWSCKQKFDCD